MRKRSRTRHHGGRCYIAFIAIILLAAVRRSVVRVPDAAPVNNKSPLLPRNNIQPEPERLVVYDWRPGVKKPSLLEMIDISKVLVARKSDVSIDAAHLLGLVHTGTAQFVLDSKNRVLLLKRGPQLMTCPNAWMMVGEHTLRNETPLETVRRCTLEELGPTALSHVQSFETLTSHPLYYYRDYGPARDNRIDRQAVYMWLVQLDVSGQDLDLEFDAEVADYQWIPLKDLEQWVEKEFQLTRAGEETSMCHVTILQLFQVGIELLKKRLISDKNARKF